jgi:putative endonuclease
MFRSSACVLPDILGRLRPHRDHFPYFVTTELVLTICVPFNATMKGGWFYLMTNRRNGILYAGVTSNLPRRAFEHRQGLLRGFTKRYGLKRLVYCERYDDIRLAIQRERTVKHWPRAWRVRLIHADNPEWEDLYEELI